MKNIIGLILILLSGSAFSQYSVTPFYTHNQSPLIHFFGLPANEGGKVLKEGEWLFHSRMNLVNNASSKRTYNERVYLDGEMYRMDFSVRYGLSKWLELGLDVPVVRHTPGRMDRMISSWHETFNLPGRARSHMPYDDISYLYSVDGVDLLRLNAPATGIGDFSLFSAFQLVNRGGVYLSLRTALKLPTGSQKQLIGSGTTDLSMQLNGTLGSAKGNRGTLFFYSGGLLLPGKSGILEDIQRSCIGFGSIGWAFGIQHRFVPKLQLDWHTPFFKESVTKQLGKTSVQIGFGAEYVLNAKTGMEFVVVEDLIVNSAPDIVFQFGFTRKL